ncbi:MAG: hypothetical protein M1274_01890 [Actinobacteria bacterium]|nr:hypothetical protein [Actinomycetota bacterium]
MKAEGTGQPRCHLKWPAAVPVWVIIVFLGLSALACGTNPAPNSGIDGVVTIGPISPVQTSGTPNSKPYQAAIDIRRLPDLDFVATVRSDANGLFRVALEPGSYRLEPRNGNPLPIAPSQEVSVFAGQYAHVEIFYDSGIR